MVRVRRYPGEKLVVIELAEELTTEELRAAREAVRSELDSSLRAVVMDMEATRSIDAAGQAFLLWCLRRAEVVGSEVVLVVGETLAKRGLGVAGLDKLFQMYGSRDEAIEELRGR